MYQPSNRFAAELNLSAPLICYQGALIREPGDGEVLWHKPLPLPLARAVISEIRKAGVHQYAYVDGSIYVEEEREEDLRYARNNGAMLHLVDDLTLLPNRPPTEVAARGTPEEIDRVLARIRACCAPEVFVNKVHASFCEIADAASGKGNALKYLSGRLGIPQSQTRAIGDSPNDVSMLRWAGLGIVVGDAPDDVRAAADWVIDHEAEDTFCQRSHSCWRPSETNAEDLDERGEGNPGETTRPRSQRVGVYGFRLATPPGRAWKPAPCRRTPHPTGSAEGRPLQMCLLGVALEGSYRARASRTFCSERLVASSAPCAAAMRRYFLKSMNLPPPSITVRGTLESFSR